MKVDLDLIRKYNVPGPRYTSYPPATHFTDEVDHDGLMANLKENNEGCRDLSLYFHLPFCETLCWFCGCTTVITQDHSRSTPYLDLIEREMDLMREHLNPQRKVVQWHLGGGTPTFLQPEDLEAGVEIDPRRISRDTIVALQESGFNRASMGVQDHHPEVQKAIHRIQPYAMTAQAIDWLRECGFESLNVDLIYGLPHQTVQSFEQTLEDTLKLQPDRFAVFSYAHVPWIKPAQKIFQERANLPSPETKLELLKLTIEKLTAEGYRYIGMDHFAREDDELSIAQRQKTLQRNFQGYSTRGGVDIYSFGMSSISQSEKAYWQNLKELPAYTQSVQEGQLPIHRGYLMSEEDLLRRQTIMRLMCDLELDFDHMSQLLGVPFEVHYQRELASLEDLREDGLIAFSQGGLKVTDLGRLLIRNIAMRFDGYQAQRTEGRFSKTI
ncbi:MAG: oxygen-independent coproporphyrinogen III oxidase [Limisphaerales bacterium]